MQIARTSIYHCKAVNRVTQTKPATFATPPTPVGGPVLSRKQK